jgi:hypothetical protein
MFGGKKGLTLSALVDHVELSDKHLVIGLHIEWQNYTEFSISVKGIQILAYLHGPKKEPLSLYPLERFSRNAVQKKVIVKTPLEPFFLPMQEPHSEHIRFISQEVFDVEPGTYTVDIQVEDTSDVTHTCRTKVRVAHEMKYRRTEEWDEGGKIA